MIVLPIAMGWPKADGKETLVLACPDCNQSRSTQIHKEHRWKARWKAGTFPWPFTFIGRILKWWRRQRQMMQRHVPAVEVAPPKERTLQVVLDERKHCRIEGCKRPRMRRGARKSPKTVCRIHYKMRKNQLIYLKSELI